ncbi:hypothetical protein FQN50_004946 [Emmonsiellopsis sp. PD_5]|nr:hypothetical protein FQN50_004946 [Emmonsiellopsis sp. PD_5]
MSFGYSVSDFIRTIELVRELRSRFIDAPEQYAEIGKGLRNLCIVLEDIQSVLPTRALTQKQKENLSSVTEGCVSVLEALRSKLGQYHAIDPDIQDGKSQSLVLQIQKAWKRIKWDPKDVEELRSRVVFSVSLLTQFHSQLLHRHSVEQMLSIKDGVDQLHQSQADSRDRETLQEILEWLTDLEYSDKQNDFYSRRQEGTGQWLLDAPEFCTWLSKSNQTLLCPGIPGAGKTILTSIVIRHLEDTFGHNEDIGISYIYLNYNRQNEQLPINVLASLLKQLVQARGVVLAGIKETFERHHPKNTRPLLSEIMGMLSLVAKQHSRLFIVVDAIDEYDNSNGNRSLFLSSIFQLQKEVNANLFVTSRHIPDIQLEFDRHGSSNLGIYAADQDIERYLVGHMFQLPSFVKANDSLQRDIVTQIMGTVDGMFLLAQLHLQSLVGKRSPKALRIALERLPRGSNAYDSAYDMAMERIQGQVSDARELALQALAWVTFAKRPLSPLELQHALAVEEETTEFDEDNISTMHDILSVCAGLLTVDEGATNIRLVHYTTQDYLRRTIMKFVPDIHVTITRICLTYLSFDVFAKGDPMGLMEKHVFFNYAASWWGYHAMEAMPAAIDIIIRFTKLTKSVAMVHRKFSGGDCYYSRFWLETHVNSWGKPSAMHLVAHFDLAIMIRPLLDQGIPADAGDEKGRTPLSYAASSGSEATIQSLLKHDVGIDSLDLDGLSPLVHAILSRRIEIVRLLLDGGAGIKYDDKYAAQPLAAAIEIQSKEMVTLLLNRGAEINVRLMDAGEATCHMKRPIYGPGRIFESQDSSAKPHPRHNAKQTPLSQASCLGHEDITRLLLDNGAEIDPRDTHNQTPLSHASLHGHESIVRLLLDHGAEVDALDFDGCTPLSHALIRGHEAVALLLLDQGANVHFKDKRGRNLMFYAATIGSVTLTQRLMNRGVDVFAKDNTNRTPFFHAVSSGNVPLTKLLMARGVEISAKDAAGRTPLFHAASTGNLDLVKLLLPMVSTDLMTQTSCGRSPLSIAALGGHSDMVALLLLKEREQDGHQQADELVREKLSLDSGWWGKCNICWSKFHPSGSALSSHKICGECESLKELPYTCDCYEENIAKPSTLLYNTKGEMYTVQGTYDRITRRSPDTNRSQTQR